MFKAVEVVKDAVKDVVFGRRRHDLALIANPVAQFYRVFCKVKFTASDKRFLAGNLISDPGDFSVQKFDAETRSAGKLLGSASLFVWSVVAASVGIIIKEAPSIPTHPSTRQVRMENPVKDGITAHNRIDWINQAKMAAQTQVDPCAGHGGFGCFPYRRDSKLGQYTMYDSQNGVQVTVNSFPIYIPK